MIDQGMMVASMDMLKNAMIFCTGATAGAFLSWVGSRCSPGEPAVSKLYWSYPVIAVLSGVSYWQMFSEDRELSEWFPGLVLLSVLTVLAVSDLKYRLLPDAVTVPAMAFFALWHLLLPVLPFWHHVLGFFVGGGIPFLVSWIAARLNKTPMGGGDIKLLAMLGLALGAERVVLVLLAASALGVAAAFFLMVTGKLERGQFVPFGPSIAAAAVLCWFFGQDWLQWYYGFFF